MNLLLVAEELTVPGWFAALELLLLVGCLLSWNYVIKKWWADEEVIPYTPRKQVPWGSDGAAIAGILLLFSVIAFFGSLSEETFETPGEVAVETASVEVLPPEDFLGEALLTEENDKEITVAHAVQYGALLGLLVVLMVAWQRMQSCAQWSDFGLSSSRLLFIKDIVLGLAVLSAALAPVYAIQALLVLFLELPSSHELINRLMDDPSGEKFLATGLLAVVIAPLFEEFVFRIMLQGWLEKIAGAKKAWPIVVSSLVFALVHQGQGYAPVPLFVLACFLGYSYQQTHRLVPCVVTHMAFNALSLATVYGTAHLQ